MTGNDKSVKLCTPPSGLNIVTETPEGKTEAKDKTQQSINSNVVRLKKNDKTPRSLEFGEW